MITYVCFKCTNRCLQFTVIIFCSLLFSETYSQTPWNWLKPLPTGNLLESIHFINQNTGYAAGVLGTVMNTTNAGANWTLQKSNVPNDLYQIFFIDKNTGLAAGKSGIILRTINGGKNWETTNSSNRSDLHDIFFVNKNTGYAAGLSGTILKTSNSGKNWTRLLKGNASLFCINFLNESFGVAAGYNIILQTSDGGNNWRTVETGVASFGTIRGIYYADVSTIYAVSNSPGGIFLRSDDGGIKWEAATLGLSYLFGGNVDLVKSMSFMNADTGFIVTGYGTILKTFNGGKLWKADSSFRTSGEKDFSMTDVNISGHDHINICGGGGTVISSTDCGNSWVVKNGNEKTLKASCRADSNFYFCAGEEGTILKSTDGGSNWFTLKNFTGKFLNSVFFLNRATGFVAGNKGVIFKTGDGGMNWTEQTGYTNLNLNSVYFLNKDTGLVAGGTPDNERAFIFRTTNGGTNWYEVYDSMSMGVFNSMKFINSSTGFLAGNNGNVLKTINAGRDWASENITAINFNSIDFIDSLNGMICGDDGIIFITTNSGASWNYTFAQTYKKLNSVKYSGRNFATAAGEDGTIVRTCDGGSSWTIEPKLTGNNLYSVNFINEKVYVFGEYGTIIFPENISTLNLADKYSTLKYFSLNQNFPNPFNPVTNLEFVVPEWGFVSIKVYDMLGKAITVLIDEKKAPGKYKIKFDGSNLPSGIYFCKMRVEGALLTRKMLLIK